MFDLLKKLVGRGKQTPEEPDLSASEVLLIKLASGGAARYDDMMEWAKSTLPKEVVDAYDATVETASVSDILAALEGIKARYDAAQHDITPDSPEELLRKNEEWRTPGLIEGMAVWDSLGLSMWEKHRLALYAVHQLNEWHNSVIEDLAEDPKATVETKHAWMHDADLLRQVFSDLKRVDISRPDTEAQ